MILLFKHCTPCIQTARPAAAEVAELKVVIIAGFIHNHFRTVATPVSPPIISIRFNPHITG